MEYPFVSCLPLIAEVRSELKVISKTSSFTEEDCYIWAVDCIRQIGGENYPESSDVITVEKHCAKLPSNFYLLDEIEVRSFGTEVYPVNSLARLASSTLLAPGDTSTLQHCNPHKKFHKAAKGFQTYTLRVPPGIARFSFYSGEVFIKFLSLRLDDDGTIMMQDEVHGQLAVKNYVKMMLLYEKWILKEVNDNVFQTIKLDFEKHLSKAQVKTKFPDHTSTNFRSLEQHNRYRRFRYF